VYPHDPTPAPNEFIPSDSNAPAEISGLASFCRRVMAFGLDFVVFTGVMLGVERMLRPVIESPENQVWVMNYLLKVMSGTPADKMKFVGTLLGILLVLLIPYDLYFIFLEYSLGATLGKRILRIRVESLDGSPLRFSQCWIRQLFRHLDCLLVVPAIGGMIYGGRKQRLGDWAAGTLVVNQLDLPPWEEPSRTPQPKIQNQTDTDLPPLPRL